MEGMQEMEIERRTHGVAAVQPHTSELPLPPPFTDRHPGCWSDSELLARILDGVADGIAAHDASGQLLFINDAGARMCGYDSAASALAAPQGDFLARVQTFDADGSLLSEAELPGPVAARGHVVPERVVRLQLQFVGAERWLSVKATPILDRRGAVRMSIRIFRDVSRARQIEAEHQQVVRELEQERTRLAALVEQLRASAAPAAASRPSDR
jgi:PAS domain-containing protein